MNTSDSTQNAGFASATSCASKSNQPALPPQEPPRQQDAQAQLSPPPLPPPAQRSSSETAKSRLLMWGWIFCGAAVVQKIINYYHVCILFEEMMDMRDWVFGRFPLNGAFRSILLIPPIAVALIEIARGRVKQGLILMIVWPVLTVGLGFVGGRAVMNLPANKKWLYERWRYNMQQRTENDRQRWMKQWTEDAMRHLRESDTGRFLDTRQREKH
jgi:hypothetical protein